MNGVQFATAVLGVVILYQLVRLAERGDLDRWVRGLSTVVRHVVSPGVPLVPWPPGGEPA